MNVLVVAEHDNSALGPATLTAVTAAKNLGKPVKVLVAGHECRSVAEAAAAVNGVAGVMHADAPHYREALPEELAPLVATACREAGHVIAPAGTFGKNLMPRVAALLGVAAISDVIRVVAEDTFVRPIYAGNALATVRSRDSVKVLTVRTTAFKRAETGGDKAPVETLQPTDAAGLSSRVDIRLSDTRRPELTAARVVVSGGRGLGGAENFHLLEKIADSLGGAVGGTRAAVDAGYIPNDFQIGQTGKIVAPDLYIAVGISGAIQHLAGMKESKVIVAINKDETAPILEVADYYLVGDLFEILPELLKELEKRM